MEKLTSSMRLKVKRDTFFLPDSDGSVYFRNNVGSFRMEGSTVDQWVERLLPMFNGKHTLEELTDGLPDEYRDRVFAIAESLFQNGFVQDVSQDLPHQLTDKVLEAFGPQIEFLGNLAGSGAYRFMRYRQAKVAAAGAGPILVSLAAALLDSGLPRLRLLITDEAATNRQRLEELAAHARKTDPEAAIEEVVVQREHAGFWREAVQPFDAVLYVSQTGDREELRRIHAACQAEGKVFVPAICLEQIGMAGPLSAPDTEGCWESAWRRIHQSALAKDPHTHAYSAAAGAMLANVIAFECFQALAGAARSELENKVYLLDWETLEGSWHSFAPHPLVAGKLQVQELEELDLLLERSAGVQEEKELISWFSELTSAETGIFHRWEEGDLIQLPLAQCRIQVADPLTDGPAGLLPQRICLGMTHEEARKEAGLAGIEQYVTRLIEGLGEGHLSNQSMSGFAVGSKEFLGVGAGETVAEGVCRALQQCLSEQFGRQQEQVPTLAPAQLSQVEDACCQYYLQALTTMQEAPRIGLGEKVSGFPVVWVGSGGLWFGSAGLNVTLALRKALQLAIAQAQDPSKRLTSQAGGTAGGRWAAQEPQSLAIVACEEDGLTEVLASARQVLKQNGKRLVLCDLALEPFLKAGLAGVFGVLLREEESR